MEKLDNLYSVLQQWHNAINDAEIARYIASSLKQDNQRTSRLIDFFATADNTKVQEVLGLECLAKAGRNHLISLGEDRISRALATQRGLEIKAVAEYAPKRINFEGQDNEFFREITQKMKPVFRRKGLGNDTPKDNFILEVPMSLPDLYVKFCEGVIAQETKSWEAALKKYSWSGCAALDDIPESEWRNLEKIHESYERNVRLKGNSISSALFRNGAEVLGPTYGNIMFEGEYYAIRNKSGKFETFYFTDSRRDLLVFVGNLLGKDVEDYLPDWKKTLARKGAKR